MFRSNSQSSSGFKQPFPATERSLQTPERVPDTSIQSELVVAISVQQWAPAAAPDAQRNFELRFLRSQDAPEIDQAGIVLYTARTCNAGKTYRVRNFLRRSYNHSFAP